MQKTQNHEDVKAPEYDILTKPSPSGGYRFTKAVAYEVQHARVEMHWEPCSACACTR